jgi:hypothetical protein
MRILMHKVNTLQLTPIQVNEARELEPFFTRMIVVETKDGERLELTMFADTPEDLYLKD